MKQEPRTYRDTPFWHGYGAAEKGLPESANPFPPGQPLTGDHYPGPYHNWQAGWRLHANITRTAA